jgi:hypothetical protein
MKRSLRNHGIGAIAGLVIGVFILHPFSMVFQRTIHPSFAIELYELSNAFNPHHLPMAVFFGIFGLLMGMLSAFYVSSLTKEKNRVRLLETLLPICAYCKKIRDDSGTERGKGHWQQVETYLAKRTDTTFTHGICPECYENVMRELEEGDDSPRDSRTGAMPEKGVAH